jgi:glycosyltransferase involved in cell wall biosynthesis
MARHEKAWRDGGAEHVSRGVMRIAQVAPLAEAVPPCLYGGTERVVSYLTEELVALGHDVTLFAAGGSRTAARLVPVVPTAFRLEPTQRDSVAAYVRMVQMVVDRADDFDVAHFHVDNYHLPTFAKGRLPYLTTMHGRLDCSETVELMRLFPDSPLVSISAAQRRPLAFANFIGTVSHGLPLNLLRPSLRHKGYLAFLGRVCPEKGLDAAIRIAGAAAMPLKVAAKVDGGDQAYYDAAIRPMLKAASVSFVGEIGQQQMGAFLGGAAALLFPIDWPEPFGLVMIEAMACGTPVIAFDRGSVGEVLEDGVSGFIVRDEVQAVSAVARLPFLNRSRVRTAFEQRFTSDRMVRDYVRLYKQVTIDLQSRSSWLEPDREPVSSR